VRFKSIGPWLTNEATSSSTTPRPWRFDCQRCGACCCNTTRNRLLGTSEYVEITRKDRLFKEDRELLKKVAVENDDGLWHMRLVDTMEPGEQRCVALAGTLGEAVRCTIYPLRPSGCRTVESGDEACRAARRQFGLPLGPESNDDDDDSADDDDDSADDDDR
jgi:Fe-S-cluster containining protein